MRNPLKKLRTRTSSNDANPASSAEVLQRRLDTLLSAVQASNILTATDDTDSTDKHYTGNPNPTYMGKVKALTKMYNGSADWGCDTAKTCIDMRAGFLIGTGVRVKKTEGYEGSAERELKFIESFMNSNNLNQSTPQKWARYAEIEGKVLVLLKPNAATRNIKVTYKQWYKNNYTVAAVAGDDSEYESVVYRGVNGFSAAPDEFVYRTFGSTMDQVNEPVSKVAMVIRNMQDLDKAIWDWRKINSLYASPTPLFTFEEEEVMQKFLESAQYKNWRIGKGIVLAGGNHELVTYSGEGFTTIKDEMLFHARKISAASGIPVHFIGHPDLLSNRDTADNLVEGIVLSTRDERLTWVDFYEEMFRKAIVMYNKQFQNSLNPDAITADVPEISSIKVTEMEKVWLPMYNAGAISLETLLTQMSSIHVREEIKRIESERNAVSQSGNSVDGAGRPVGNGGQAQTGNNQGE